MIIRFGETGTVIVKPGRDYNPSGLQRDEEFGAALVQMQQHGSISARAMPREMGTSDLTR